MYGPAIWLSPRKKKRTDIEEDDSPAEEDENILDYTTDSSSAEEDENILDYTTDSSSAEEDENILDYAMDSSSDNDEPNNVTDNGKLNIEKAVWDGPGI